MFQVKLPCLPPERKEIDYIFFYILYLFVPRLVAKSTKSWLYANDNILVRCKM